MLGLLLLLLPAAALGTSGAVPDGPDEDIREDIPHGLQIVPAARRVAAEDVEAGILRRPDERRIGMGILPVAAPGQVAVLLHEAKVDEADAAGEELRCRGRGRRLGLLLLLLGRAARTPLRRQHEVVGLDVDEEEAHGVERLQVGDERGGDGAEIDFGRSSTRTRRPALLGRRRSHQEGNDVREGPIHLLHAQIAKACGDVMEWVG